ncbi:LOB domain-containing protein 2 [Bienertia sinuspersici]
MVRNLLNDEDRKRAADSLVWEALCRQKDPILGPYGEFRKIYDELKSYQTQVVQTQTGQFVAPNGHTNGSVYKNGNGLIGWNVTTNGSGSINNKMSYNGGSMTMLHWWIAFGLNAGQLLGRAYMAIVGLKTICMEQRK